MQLTAVVSATEGKQRLQALWLVGPTAMIITSVVTTATVAYLDHQSTLDPRMASILSKVTEHRRSLKA